MSAEISPCTTPRLRASCEGVQKSTGPRGVASRLRSTSLILWLGALGLLAACDDAAQTRADAKKLFELLSALQEERSLAVRESALTNLAALTLNEPAQRSARDACVRAHRELLRAEAEQTAARKALDEATQSGTTATLSPERAATIAKSLEQSNAALERAQAQFPPCEAAMQSLLAEAR
jgi:hypothetical protein